jgi:hypothetical protein
MHMDAGRLAALIEEQAMHSMTLEQLRATASAGGVKGVTLKGQGGSFSLKSPLAAVRLPFWRRPAHRAAPFRQPACVRERVVQRQYIVFHRVLDEIRTVEILRVKHAAQQMP